MADTTNAASGVDGNEVIDQPAGRHSTSRRTAVDGDPVDGDPGGAGTASESTSHLTELERGVLARLPSSLQSLKVPELKEVLGELRLPKTGKKSQLVETLQSWVDAVQDSDAESQSGSESDSDSDCEIVRSAGPGPCDGSAYFADEGRE